MDEYADIYYVDGRNATTVQERSGQQGNRHGQAVRVGSRGPGGFGQSQRGYPQERGYPPEPRGYYAHEQQAFGGSALFGRMTTGQVVDMVAQIFAALMPLPTAPVATADVPTDVGNLILYQGSVAQYAKRDEQVRTLGNLVMKLVG